MSANPTFAPDAALVLGIAATAIPFARTPEDQAERWLRLLRLHGEVGVALQSLGVSEGSLDNRPAPREPAYPGVGASDRPGAGAPEQGDVIAIVSDRAVQTAVARGASGVGTTELLIALLEVYGEVFERTLRAHGTDADEVLERLAA
ncbi:MAG TPA: hypothetical protein VGH09_05235 [Solirubrobacteraceae bacterium]